MNHLTIPTVRLVRDRCPQTIPSENHTNVEVWHDPQGITQAIGHTVAGEHWFHVLGLASYHLNAEPEVVTAYTVSAILEEDVVERYYRTALPLALQIRGLGVLHASSVLGEAGVIGFCAASMVGKSTLAYALSKQGYLLWGDDVLAFQNEATYPISYPLPFRMRLRPTAANHYQLPIEEDVPRWETSRQKGDNRPHPLAALIILERLNTVKGELELERLKVTTTYNALLEHAFIFTLDDAESRRNLMQSYLRLSAQVPIFRLSYRSGLELLPELLNCIGKLNPPTLPQAQV